MAFCWLSNHCIVWQSLILVKTWVNQHCKPWWADLGWRWAQLSWYRRAVSARHGQRWRPAQATGRGRRGWSRWWSVCPLGARDSHPGRPAPMGSPGGSVTSGWTGSVTLEMGDLCSWNELKMVEINDFLHFMLYSWIFIQEGLIHVVEQEIKKITVTSAGF